MLPLLAILGQQRHDQELFRAGIRRPIRFDPAAVAKVEVATARPALETGHEWRRKDRYDLFHRSGPET